ncbi:MAG: hypothetical protein J6Y37_02435 [Paludibacteraceae bacterium]|nr:hypothetical protein [Paludibacteraceae bacterium]
MVNVQTYNTSIPEDKVRFTFWWILKHPEGYKDALDTIHPQSYDYLISAGHIKSGVDAVGHTRYSLTNEGRLHVSTSYIAMTAKALKGSINVKQ